MTKHNSWLYVCNKMSYSHYVYQFNCLYVKVFFTAVSTYKFATYIQLNGGVFFNGPCKTTDLGSPLLQHCSVPPCSTSV